MAINRVGILYHPMNKAAYALAKKVQEYLNARTDSVWLCSAWEEEKAKAEVNGTDLILTIGGDGTILRAVQVALHSLIPLTGINLGKLGFMTELSADEALSTLPALLAGGGWIDERLGRLLLRLYEQSQDSDDVAVQGTCLDAWDMMIESRVAGLQGLDLELDN